MTYFALGRKQKQLVATFQDLQCLADVFTASDEESVLNLFHTALEGTTTIDIHRLHAECMVGIGDNMIRRGNGVEAKEIKHLNTTMSMVLPARCM
jgi:hypothetical protein